MGKRKFMKFAFAIMLAGCASSGGNEPADAGAAGSGATGGITVTVTNAVVPPAAITLWMVPQTGSRRRLGTIQPNQQGTFTFAPTVPAIEHTLQAEHVGGGQTTSNPFVLSGVTRVTWQTSSPVVNLGRSSP